MIQDTPIAAIIEEHVNAMLDSSRRLADADQKSVVAATARLAADEIIHTIIERLGHAYHPQNPIPDHPADFIEREFTPYPKD